jgi:cell division transport system ATP-binding protein
MSFESDPVISVKNATIFQEQKPVLEEVNIDVDKGEFVFMIGRTGSGKSSLLKTMYADLPLRNGDMVVAGFNIKDIKRSEVPFLRRKLGIIFQDFQLFQDRTVAENLEFVMKATGWKEKSKMKARQAEVLMRVGLGAIANKYPFQLSGGEQQRVVIARALINEPLILLADEPTGNLDPEVSDGIYTLFQEINRSGTTILMATHDHNLIKSSRERVMQCKDGKISDTTTASLNPSSH